MIWTTVNDLSAIACIANDIVTDVSNDQLVVANEYAQRALRLLNGSSLSVQAICAAVADIFVIDPKLDSEIISIVVGIQQGNPQCIVEAKIALGGALCRKLFYRHQMARAPLSFQMAAEVQKHWLADIIVSEVLSDEWVSRYYGTVYEFEGHAEQIAYEVWASYTLANFTPPKAIRLSSLQSSHAWTRISSRLGHTNSQLQFLRNYVLRLEEKVNEALRAW